MRIGVITYWESNDNYGQQLQCWALQCFLREKGHDAFLIRQYVWPPSKKKGLRRLKRWIKDKLATILYSTNLAYNYNISRLFAFCLDREACRRQFPRFRRQNMKMSKIYTYPETLTANPPAADIYITGSDQVWNYDMPESSLKNYFLQFGDKDVKRIAYAASIGHKDFPSEIQESIKSYLQLFSAISTRESSAVKAINMMGFDAKHVVDPTMLLKPEEYLLLANKESIRECVYIYSMNYEKKEDIPFCQIQQYAKEHELPIIVTTGSGYLPAKELFEDVEYSYATISQWIRHIADARMVITASFHGIVFSLLFHRNFIYTPLQGALSGGNNRILDLLNVLGLDEQVLKHNKAISDYEISIEKWQIVDKLLDKYITSSVNYLLNAINE